MKMQLSSVLGVFLTIASARGQNADAFYKLGPDSLVMEGVPQGKLVGPHTLPCEVFPGTSHTYSVYVPPQYDASKPASLMIFQDGHAFFDPNGSIRAQNVLNNLIYRRELPVMIAVFINPGRSPDQTFMYRAGPATTKMASPQVVRLTELMKRNEVNSASDRGTRLALPTPKS